MVPVPSAAAAETSLVVPSDRRMWLKIIAVSALIVALYYRVAIDLAEDWLTLPAWSHGVLIPPLALYVAWIQRERLFKTPAHTDLRGLYLIGSSCLLYLLGLLGAEFFLTRTSLVLLLAGLVWTFWGLPRLRALAFPLLLLGTMIPLPVIVFNWVALPLQLFASSCAATLAQMAGITVYQDGNVINLAHVSLGVEEACSGLNSLSALTVASALLGFVMCTRLRSRILLVFLGIPLAIGVNVLRITGTAILADFHEEFALGFYHLFSGWLIFLVGFGLLYLTARALHALLD